jgi:putative transposase
MSHYRRNYEEGGIYFFTVVTYKRQKIFIGPSVDMLRLSFEKVIAEAPFRIQAIVVMPDHMHCIWQLPRGDDDFSMRWKKLKVNFQSDIINILEASSRPFQLQ